MTMDRYTRIVLTVIAGTLLYIAVMLSGRAVLAQADAPAARGLLQRAGAQPVVIVGWGSVRSDGELTITTVKDAGGLMRTDPTLQVRVSQLPERPLAVTLGATPEHPLPVGITGIKAGAEWDPIAMKAVSQVPQKTPGFPKE